MSGKVGESPSASADEGDDPRRQGSRWSRLGRKLDRWTDLALAIAGIGGLVALVGYYVASAVSAGAANFLCPTSLRGTESFYSAGAGVSAGLLIAAVLAAAHMTDDRHQELLSAKTWLRFLVITLPPAGFVLLGLAVYGALDALRHCPSHSAHGGNTHTYAQVAVGIAAGLLVLGAQVGITAWAAWQRFSPRNEERYAGRSARGQRQRLALLRPAAHDGAELAQELGVRKLSRQLHGQA
jgi:hypothetical protein